MKVGILTITIGTNYGNRLQNYASQTVLESLGCEVETVRNITNQKPPALKIGVKGKIKHKILFPLYMKTNLIKSSDVNGQIRIANFKKFNKEYIHETSELISKDNIPEGFVDKFDYFICGSDQVWNPNFYFNSEMDFLTFAKSGQRIAYAPSFGISEIPEDFVENYKKWINGMDYLSCREEAGAQIIKNLTGREATVLVDPTLMLTKEQWLNMSNTPKWIRNKKYVLTYFLGDKTKEIEERVNKIAKEKNLEVINLLDKNNKYIYSAGPREFVSLINEAECMCTDSFHGVVFSLIMKTPFMVFERKGPKMSMNSRMDTLLSLFKMEHRKDSIIKDNKEVFDMDFSYVDKILNVERDKAINYLKDALKLNN